MTDHGKAVPMTTTSAARSRARRLFGAGFAVAAVLAAAGCAGQDTPGSAASAGSSDMTLNVGQISDSVAFFPLFVAEENGYFEDEGLTMGERPRLGTGAKVAAALQSGDIDVGAGVLTDAFNFASQNEDATLLGALATEYYVDITVSPEFDGPDSDASLEDRIRALEGKNIGITGPGSGTEALVTYLFDLVGMDPTTDATLVNLGAQATAAVGALQTGRVDALAFFQPVGEQAEATDVGEIYISPARGDVPDIAGQLHGALFATGQVVEEKPDAVAAFMRAIARAQEDINGDAAEVEDLLQAYQGNLPAETVSALVPILQEEIPDSPEATEEAYATGVEFHQSSGLFEDPPAYDDFVDAAWLTSALEG